MKKKLLSILIFACLAVLVIGSVPVSASEPFDTYTYSSQGDVLLSPAAYSPMPSIVDSTFMELERYWPVYAEKYAAHLRGIGKTEKEISDTLAVAATKENVSKLIHPNDMTTDPFGNVYIVDTGNNRIVVLDPSYKYEMVIDYFASTDSDYDSFKSPQGVFVNEDYIYVCDTDNYRIVMFNRKDGSFHKIISKPSSPLFGMGDEVLYTPIACAVDQYGRIYVVASSCNEGIIVLASDDGDFTGFIGAQKVEYSVIQIFWRRFQSAEQRAKEVQFVPTPYNNLTIDENGFIYATIIFTGSSIGKQQAAITSKDATYSPVKKYNSGGTEIMKRNGFYDCGGEVAITLASMDIAGTGVGGVSEIVDVAIGEEGSWSIIDRKRSRVYTYDGNGELLFAFGDKGSTVGTQYQNGLRAITYQGSKMLLLDYTSESITVFERTDYGNLLIQALAYENSNRYDEAEQIWKEILQRNNNFDAAYIGIGKAIYRDAKTKADYEEAMEYFAAAHETTYYSDAYAAIRAEWISKYFIVIVLVAIAAIFLIVKGLGAAKKFNTKTALKVGKKTYWEELVYAFHLCFHPFDGFWDLKHEKRGSLRAGLTIMGLTILAFYYQSVGQGYIFNPYDVSSTILVQIISVAVPVLLWTTANWCLTTLFDGEGSFKDVLMAVCYSLAPLPPMLIISTLLSNVLTLEEGAIATMLVVLGAIWTFFLIFFGMLVTHDYTLGKNIITTLGTILCMAVIIFVIVLFASLLGKMVQFISAIVSEVSYRA